MKKRMMSLFMVVSMSFTLFYPEMSLNDNVLVIEEAEMSDAVENEKGLDAEHISSTEFSEENFGEEVSVLRLMRVNRSDKKFKLKLLEWIRGFSK